MHANVGCSDAALREGLYVGAVHGRRDLPALLHKPGKAAERVAPAHHVYDRLYPARMSYPHGVEEAPSGVIYRLRRPQIPRERLVCLTRGGDHPGAAPGGQLTRVGADAAGGPHD